LPSSSRRAAACEQLSATRKASFGGARLAPARAAAPARPARRGAVAARAERGGAGFMSGFVVGGIMFGVLGFVFAPQLSRALLGEDQRLRLPRFMEEEEADPEVTRQTLAEKIAQLNDAIDDVSSQLRAQGQESDEAAA
jgi:hypothetical protein